MGEAYYHLPLEAGLFGRLEKPSRLQRGDQLLFIEPELVAADNVTDNSTDSSGDIDPADLVGRFRGRTHRVYLPRSLSSTKLVTGPAMPPRIGVPKALTTAPTAPGTSFTSPSTRSAMVR